MKRNEKEEESSGERNGGGRENEMRTSCTEAYTLEARKRHGYKLVASVQEVRHTENMR
jgi:hypothetical protein